jgi:serine protease inhibitor
MHFLHVELFPGEAELERMSEDGSKLAVDKIAHAALIDVDKDGTEGAAATVVEIVFLR